MELEKQLKLIEKAYIKDIKNIIDTLFEDYNIYYKNDTSAQKEIVIEHILSKFKGKLFFVILRKTNNKLRKAT